jgi:cytoplasmic iron level regulating protein YaaA (DUF328/UPF0246 family)
MINKTNYTILLPPSEGKNQNSTNNKYSIEKSNKINNYFIELDNLRYQISSNLKESITSSDETKHEKILDLKGKNLKSAIQKTLNFDNELTIPAINRYDGVMFKAINFQGMKNTQKENFNNSVIFIDGMFGLLKPQDLIPDYKLKITSKFGTFNMTSFWKENLYQILNKIFQNTELVIDILPGAHRKVVNFSNAKNYVEIMFATLKNGKLKNAGHESKKLKGEIINFIVEHDTISIDKLKTWKHSSGYSYDAKNSNEHLICYVKN